MQAITGIPASWVALVEQSDGCWAWRGTVSADGYGKFYGRQAHRVIYEALVGPIEVGLELDHLCRNKGCVNPGHLEPVTRLENMRRRYALYTHCKAGHEFTATNTYVMPNGHRSCRTCRHEAVRRYRSRNRRRA